MIIVVTPAEGDGARAAVTEPDNLRRLQAEFRGVSDSAAAEALSAADLGAVEGDHVWLNASALRAAGDGSPEWTRQFDAMMSYAQAQGWVRADGTQVRAHIERAGDG